jgi:hypothetical protein
VNVRAVTGSIIGVVLLAAVAGAQTPSPGAKAIGMGGTFVATGDDATSLWGNPAGLAQCPLGCGVLFGSAVGTDENGFAKTLRDDFSGLDLASLTDPAEIARLEGDLARLQVQGTGVIGSGNAGIAYALRGWAIGIGATVYTGAYPVIHTIDVGGVTLPSLASRVILKGLEARELRLGYAGTYSGLTIGIDGRYIEGRTYLADESLADVADDPAQIFRDALKKNERQTNKFSADIGATYSFAGKVRLGVVGQNLNEPEFTVADGSTVPLPRTYRAGAAFAPVSFDGIVFSADADINHQKTLIPGLTSRRIAGGAQIFFLQVGAFRDLDAVDPHWAYTAGLHLGLKVLSIGISGAYSSDRRDIGAAAEVRVKL